MADTRVDRLEGKVDELASTVSDIRADVASIKRSLDHRDALEKQAQILKAETDAARQKLEEEKKTNEKAWMKLKSAALYIVVGLCFVSTYPNIAIVLQKLGVKLPW